jgi:hypothetical protein
MAYQNLEKTKKRDLPQESEASERTETPAEALGFNNTPWTAEEQKLLEQVGMKQLDRDTSRGAGLQQQVLDS